MVKPDQNSTSIEPSPEGSKNPGDSKESEASKKSKESLAPPSRAGRTLVLCFDGTSNSFNDTNTNVVKLVAMLEKNTTTKQIVYYQAGVGTYVAPGFLTPVGTWIAKTADLALAWYLDDHVKDGYRFLQSTWKPGDKICMFGFSRGAYTARALAGMLYKVGLLPPGMVEQVDFAYSIFKEGRQSNTYKAAFSRTVKIEFIGVWDTVSSVGALVPRVLPFSGNNNITKTFRHALALDERRAKFRSNTWHVPRKANKNPIKNIRGPLRWVFYLFQLVSARRAKKGALDHRKPKGERKSKEDRKPKEDHKAPDDDKALGGDEALGEHEALEDGDALDKQQEKISKDPTDVMEVWFPGCHADVGGGNVPDFERVDGVVRPRPMLSNTPLYWMLQEVIKADVGIIFQPAAMKLFGIDHDPFLNAAKGKPNGAATPPASPLAHTKTAAHDFAAPIHDELSMPGLSTLIFMWFLWWFLEYIPVLDFTQDDNHTWGFALRFNRGRPRDIPRYTMVKNANSPYADKTTNNIPPLFHKSVHHRINAPKPKILSWSSLWSGGHQPYQPGARRNDTEPIFVD